MEEGEIRPHHSLCRLNPKITDKAQYDLEVRAVCAVYSTAAALAADAVRVVSCDDKTTIQALERAAPTTPTRPSIRFVYTPKHCSLLNQSECWFSVLVRRVLRRGSFTSIDEMDKAVLDFIEYFNRLFAKPIKWTYTGRALTT